MAQSLRGLGKLLLRRPSAAPLRRPSSAPAKRTFASESAQHEDAEEAVKWRNITIVAYITCTALGVYNMVGEHEEPLERKEYSYLHIRNKEFPWGALSASEKVVSNLLQKKVRMAYSNTITGSMSDELFGYPRRFLLCLRVSVIDLFLHLSFHGKCILRSPLMDK